MSKKGVLLDEREEHDGALLDLPAEERSGLKWAWNELEETPLPQLLQFVSFEVPKKVMSSCGLMCLLSRPRP